MYMINVNNNLNIDTTLNRRYIKYLHTFEIYCITYCMNKNNCISREIINILTQFHIHNIYAHS